MEDVLNPKYWSERLHTARPLFRSVYRVKQGRMAEIEAAHTAVLEAELRERDSMLDAGCGYGRLLNSVPGSWKGWYTGVDFCPDFIRVARQLYPTRSFVVADLRQLPFKDKNFDVAVVCSVKHMVIRNTDEAVWAAMEEEITRVAKRVLYLEYET